MLYVSARAFDAWPTLAPGRDATPGSLSQTSLRARERQEKSMLRRAADVEAWPTPAGL
jgi:hypothetical protein